MIEHHWSIICEKSVIDKESNNISIFQTLEKISLSAPELPNAPTAPVFPINFEIVSLWSRVPVDKPERGKMRWRILAPDGGKSSGTEFDLNLEKFQRLRTRLRIAGLAFSGNGNYRICVDLYDRDKKQWEQAASLPLELLFNIIEDSSA